ncbi:MAG: PLP-dependent transferase [Eubacteriaceae bacterium]|nr:PLP-dependent transferase [Eubacteriaceae bacterium]
MQTPLYDFMKAYAESGFTRFHMPGHKGKKFVGYEDIDITEFYGADSLYEADGIIAASEQNATNLFGTKNTFYSAEGSSQCIRAMMYLAMINKKGTSRPKIVAARNVHKSFIYAATLLDFDIVWLWPKGDIRSLCSCEVSRDDLEDTLRNMEETPAAVYITSPDYLGGMADIKGLSEVCHKYGTILIVDNAHGAYLKFLTPSLHPMDLGADICCDSAHKTLPVVTGGAYLHISKDAPESFGEYAKYALALFGSTSPSYLIMASLDLCNKYLSESYKERLEKTIGVIEDCKEILKTNGWQLEKTDPLKITISAPDGMTGLGIADILRRNRIECEYSDPEYVVLMATPENNEEDFSRLINSLGKNERAYSDKISLPIKNTESVMTVRNAVFSEHEMISSKDGYGRICRELTVACPPAIPIAVPGEIISEDMVKLFEYYGVENINVVKQAGF